jgi:hypothetical protein
MTRRERRDRRILRLLVDIEDVHRRMFTIFRSGVSLDRLYSCTSKLAVLGIDLFNLLKEIEASPHYPPLRAPRASRYKNAIQARPPQEPPSAC